MLKDRFVNPELIYIMHALMLHKTYLAEFLRDEILLRILMQPPTFTPNLYYPINLLLLQDLLIMILPSNAFHHKLVVVIIETDAKPQRLRHF